jgi:NAD+ synthase (glutamine-hydrolysing)
MKTLRVALAQIAPVLGDLERNLALHLDRADRAASDGASVVVFPELSLCGYLLRDHVPEVALTRESPVLLRLAEASRRIDILFGFVEESRDHRFYNAAGYFAGGRLVHLHRKLYLPTYGMLDEARDFGAGHLLRPFESPHGANGILICEDLWHPTSSWLLAQEGAEVIYAISSSPTRGAKPGREVTTVAVWRQLLQVTAQFQTTFMVYVNRIGCEDGLTFGGGSIVVDPFGRVVAEIPALEDALVVAELDGEALRRARAAYPLLRDERLDLVHRELERIRRRRYELPQGRDEAGEGVS